MASQNSDRRLNRSGSLGRGVVESVGSLIHSLYRLGIHWVDEIRSIESA
jgi:hypothetical protein